MAHPGSPAVSREPPIFISRQYLHHAAAEAVAVTLATLLSHRRDIHTYSLAFANSPTDRMSAYRSQQPIYQICGLVIGIIAHPALRIQRQRRAIDLATNTLPPVTDR
jgi:hypothetical protein